MYFKAVAHGSDKSCLLILFGGNCQLYEHSRFAAARCAAFASPAAHWRRHEIATYLLAAGFDILVFNYRCRLNVFARSLCDRSVGIYPVGSFVLLVCVARCMSLRVALCTSLHVACCCRGIGRSSGMISMRGTVLDSCSVLVCCAVTALGSQCETRKERRGAPLLSFRAFRRFTCVPAHAHNCTHFALKTHHGPRHVFLYRR